MTVHDQYRGLILIRPWEEFAPCLTENFFWGGSLLLIIMLLDTPLWWAAFIELIRKPPHSLWFVFVICLLVSSFSTFLNKKLVDHDKAARIQLEVKKHADEKKVLLKMSEENPKRYKKEYKKWNRRDESVKKMQQNMTMQRLKPTCFTFIPLIAFFYVIRAIYTPDGSIQLPVARPAMNPMGTLPDFLTTMLRSRLYSAIGNISVKSGFLGYSGWYMLCSMTVSTILQRLFGISQTSQQGGGAGGMFDSSAQMELPDPSSL